jgi:hypothetical protein
MMVRASIEMLPPLETPPPRVSPPPVKEEKREVPGNVATPMGRNRSRHLSPSLELLRPPA